ncbi:MAG: AraC family transcriptional regulator [Bacteroidota bacterium]|nr:AraC family transcriptional regulator [Bacteroidota bacterium]
MKNYDFYKTKYGRELLIDLIPLERLQSYLDHVPTHTLSYYDITLIGEGSGTFTLDGSTTPIEKGMLFFSAPGQIRQWNFDRMPQGLVLIFEETFLCDYFNDARFVENLSYFCSLSNPPSMLLSDAEYRELVPLLETIYREIAEYETKDKHILRALLYHATMLLNRMYLQRYPVVDRKPEGRYIHEFRALVEKEFRQCRSVACFADLLHITPGHLNDIVRREMGITAKQFIIDRTMREAKRMLGYTGLSVNEVAMALNFENPSYFTRLFEKHVGVTPLQFRTKILEK